MALLSDGTERVGILGSDEYKSSCNSSLPYSTDPLLRIVEVIGASKKVELKISDFSTGELLSHEICPTAQLNGLFAASVVPMSTIFSPQLVYLNHDLERSPLEAIEAATALYAKELDFSAFVAKTSHTSRLISQRSSSSISVAEFLASLSPPESTKRRTKKQVQSIDAVELHLLQSNSNRSMEECNSVSIRYDAIRPSEPSLDDSTHEDFEKNARVFHAFYPRISVLLYLVKADFSDNSLCRALERQMQAIKDQLKIYSLLAKKLDKPRGVVPQIEPIHFQLDPTTSNLGNSQSKQPVFMLENESETNGASSSSGASKEIITLWYELPSGSYEWQSEYASRLALIDPKSEMEKLGFSHAVPLPLATNNTSVKGPNLRDSARLSILDSIDASARAETRLSDVHRFVPSPGSQYSVHVVKGSYDYYHYGQDGYDDKGWGCAYRSMQTLVSWIVKQNVSIRAVPAHVEIQRMLVDMMDKPPSFVNSKQWIGAVEISMCLSQHWDVVSKILHAPDGSKVSLFVDELINHFDTLGSPIMVGGSVLAYTILGVAVNQVSPTLPNGSPDIKYLILDPHYVGPENVDTVTSKGWCAWQPPSIFRKDAFYNLCVPQTPKWDLL